MKDFRLYRGKSDFTPARLAADCTHAEITAFQKEIRLSIYRYHRRERAALRWLCALALFLIAGIIFRGRVLALCLVGAAITLAVIAFVGPRSPKCSCCHHRLGAGFGPFCPACGSRSLAPVHSFHMYPRCGSCGRTLWTKGARSCVIRACTFCGLKFDGGQGL